MTKVQLAGLECALKLIRANDNLMVNITNVRDIFFASGEEYMKMRSEQAIQRALQYSYMNSLCIDVFASELEAFIENQKEK